MVWSAGRGEGGWWWVSRLILSTYSPHEPRAFFFLAPADIYLILPTFFVLFSPTCASNALQHWVGLHFSQHSSCPDYAWLRHFSPYWGTKQQPKSYSAPLSCHPPSPSKKNSPSSGKESLQKIWIHHLFTASKMGSGPP